jgi:pimeloyl-ACP methyl ester carboxylesterase
MPDLTPDASGFVDAGPHRLWWERFGRGEREAVCLLNGLAMHTRAWYGFLPRLHPEWDVILYDYPGQGQARFDDRPVLMPELADGLACVLDALGVARVHVMGISYGGFVALDFARLHASRLRTLTLSGILLSRERLFDMYQDLSLRFYRGGPQAFELYTHYMYEKIFGEDFVRATPPEQLEGMRAKFHERFQGSVQALVRLTEAQDPFFAALDANLPGYRAVSAPTLVLAGAQDRAIPPPVQRKLAAVFPNARYEEIEGSGHVVYLEKPDAFFARWHRLLRQGVLDA